MAPLKELWTWARPLLRKSPPPSPSATPVGPLAPPCLVARSDFHPNPAGLICLKGGDLAAEIADSGCRPRIIEIHEIFPLDYFHEKYLLRCRYNNLHSQPLRRRLPGAEGTGHSYFKTTTKWYFILGQSAELCPMIISVCIVDDNKDIRSALEQIILMAEGYTLAGSYSDAEEALQKIPAR